LLRLNDCDKYPVCGSFSILLCHKQKGQTVFPEHDCGMTSHDTVPLRLSKKRHVTATDLMPSGNNDLRNVSHAAAAAAAAGSAYQTRHDESSGSHCAKRGGHVSVTHKASVERARDVCNVLKNIPVSDIRTLVHDLTRAKHIEPFAVADSSSIDTASKRSLCSWLGNQLKDPLVPDAYLKEYQHMQQCFAKLDKKSPQSLRNMLHALQPSLSQEDLETMTKLTLCQAISRLVSQSEQATILLETGSALESHQQQMDQIMGPASATHRLVPTYFQDAVTKKLMVYPHQLRNGYTFEYTTLQDCHDNDKGCPRTNDEVTHYAPNRALEAAIDGWLRENLGFSLEQLRERHGVSHTFQDWQFVSKLGAGVYGEVGKYRHKVTGEFIAIKKINKCYDVDPEIAALRALKGVCPQYLVCFVQAYLNEPGQYYYLTTEYLGAFQELKSSYLGLLEDDLLQAVFTNMVRGLDSIHQHGIVHGDIHGGNIMIHSRTGQVKYIDFGASRTIASLALSRTNVSDWLRADWRSLKQVIKEVYRRHYRQPDWFVRKMAYWETHELQPSDVEHWN
jgi:hypothetical protein